MEDFNFTFPIVKNISSKTLAEDIESKIPYIPEDYDSWPEENVTYMVSDISEVKNYIENWFKEHPKVPKDWLQWTSIYTMSLTEKKKGYSCFEIYVDDPNDCGCIHIYHQEIGKLPIDYDIKEIKNIISEIKEQ